MVSWLLLIAQDLGVKKGRKMFVETHVIPQQFFVHAITTRGAVFDSEHFGVDDMVDIIIQYASVLEYFGGGRLFVYSVDGELEYSRVI